jgi:hypothetical protein
MNSISLCGAVQLGKEVCKCFPPGTQQLMVPTLIGLFAQLAGVNLTCEAAQQLASQYACVPPPQQLPLLIGLIINLINNGGIVGGAGVGEIVLYSSGGLGTPPPFTPQTNATSTPGVSTGALATDTSTGEQWVWYSGTWN